MAMVCLALPAIIWREINVEIDLGRPLRPSQRLVIRTVSCPTISPGYGPISSSTFVLYVPSANMTGVSHTPLHPNSNSFSASTLPF